MVEGYLLAAEPQGMPNDAVERLKVDLRAIKPEIRLRITPQESRDRFALHAVEISLKLRLVGDGMHHAPFGRVAYDDAHMREEPLAIESCHHLPGKARSAPKQQVAYAQRLLDLP